LAVRSSVAFPERLPLGPGRQGPQFQQRPDVLDPPARPRLLEPLVQQLLEGAPHQPAAERLPAPEPQRLVQPALVGREVVQHLPQGRITGLTTRASLIPTPQAKIERGTPLRNGGSAVVQEGRKGLWRSRRLGSRQKGDEGVSATTTPPPHRPSLSPGNGWR
jgi:hypothetical protein